METRITQCPRCGTSFRVTDALLAVAAGAVRCGSCLHIFNARDNWLDDKAAEEKKAAESAAKTAKVEKASQLAANKPERREPVIDDDALFDDDTPLFSDEESDDDDSKGNRSIFNPADADFAPATEAGDSSGYDNFLDDTDWLTPNKISFDEPVAENEEAHDDDWAEDLLRDDVPPPAPKQSETETPQLSEADRSITRLSIISDYQLEHDDILAQVPEETESSSAHPDDIILDLPSAFDPGLRPAPAGEEAAETQPETAAETAENFSAGDRIGGENLASLRGLNTEPIRMHQFVREKRWPKVLWGLAFVIAAAALPAQYLYFNFDNLARGELRPWLAQACDLIGCRLPAQSDPAHVRTGSLIVRSHPSVRGALAVDAIITNLAPFAQPYPELVLQFTDINGAPIAGRRFKPEEYLGGELTGSHLMPIGQPIHVGLEVRDPGPRAVNYLLSVSPAQN